MEERRQEVGSLWAQYESRRGRLAVRVPIFGVVLICFFFWFYGPFGGSGRCMTLQRNRCDEAETGVRLWMICLSAVRACRARSGGV